MKEWLLERREGNLTEGVGNSTEGGVTEEAGAVVVGAGIQNGSTGHGVKIMNWYPSILLMIDQTEDVEMQARDPCPGKCKYFCSASCKPKLFLGLSLFTICILLKLLICRVLLEM